MSLNSKVTKGLIRNNDTVKKRLVFYLSYESEY